MHVKPGFNGQIWQNSPKIDDLWHMTSCSIAFFERIPNLYLIWSNSVILPVKSTSNRFFVVKNGKIPQDQWLMTCDPLFDCIFREDSESVLGLVKFGHFTGQIDVKPVFRGQKWLNPPRSMTHDMWTLVRLHFSRRFRICTIKIVNFTLNSNFLIKFTQGVNKRSFEVKES